MNNSINYLLQPHGTPILSDSIDNDNTSAIKTSSARDNTLNPKYIKHVHHYFNHETSEYEYSRIWYTGSRIKDCTRKFKTTDVNLLKYRAEHNLAYNPIRQQIFDTIETLKDNTEIVINTDYRIFGISTKDKIKAEQQITITSNYWQTKLSDEELDNYKEIQHIEIHDKAAKDKIKQEYHSAKSNLSPSLFPIIDRENTITETIMAELNSYDIVRLSTINRIIEKYDAIIGIEWKWQEEIIRPCYYKHGIEQTSREFDANSYFIYFNDRNIRGWIGNKADRKNATKLLFRFAIALLYINGYLTDNEKKERLTTDLVVYSALIILQKYFIQGRENGNDWIKDMNLIKFISKIIQFCEESNTVKDALDGVKSDRNSCLFPDGWNEDEKREWKDSNNIERKKHKERKDKGEKHMFKEEKANQSKVGMKYKKQLDVELLTRILGMRNEGKTMEEIASELGTNKMKISRLLKKISEENIIEIGND